VCVVWPARVPGLGQGLDCLVSRAAAAPRGLARSDQGPRPGLEGADVTVQAAPPTADAGIRVRIRLPGIPAGAAYLGGPLSQRRVLPHFDRIQPRNGHGRPQAPMGS
jgi:hypothetical protein